MKITIGTKNQIFKTIGHDEDFHPVLLFKIGQRKQAIDDLTNYFCKWNDVLATGISFTEDEYNKFSAQFMDVAKREAMEVLERAIENDYQGKFFTFLPKFNREYRKIKTQH